MNFEKSDQLSIDDKKREFLCALLSLIVSVILLAIINYTIFLVYRPNIDEIVQQAASVSHYDKSLFAPEPVERLQFIFSVLLSPCIVFLAYSAINKIVREINFFKEKTGLIYLFGVLGTTTGIISLFYKFAK